MSTDSDGDVVARSWDFDDGSTSTEQNPSHCYAAGTYDVSLTVTDDQSAESEQVADTVEVSARPGGDVVQVFISSAIGNGTHVGGLNGADNWCQSAAENAGLAGTWTAWLSGDNTNTRDCIPDGQYELLDGTVIADDMADLTDGELKAPINLNEFGEAQGGVAWTGTKPDGTATGTNCSNWQSRGNSSGCTAGDPNCGDRGDNSTTNSDWTQLPAQALCSSQFSIYCFGGCQ